MMVVTVILAVLGLFILAVGALSFTQTLPGNPVIGLRIPEVRASEENWKLGHKLAGPAWIGAGVAMLAAALVASSAKAWLWLVVALLVIGSLFLVGMGAAMAAHTMAQIDARRRKAEEAAGGDGCSCGSEGGCGSHAGDEAGAASGAAGGAVSAESCASGEACGSCSLNGACEGGSEHFEQGRAQSEAAGVAAPSPATRPAIDFDAARRATASRDQH